MSREQFNCQQTHLKFNTTYRSRSGSLMDCSPRAFFPALPTPPPHNRREATPGGGGRREGAGRARSPELRGRGRRARADPPSPAPARDWLPRVGRAAPRCTAAPPCGAGAPAQADAERGAPPPPAPAAPQPPPEPRSEPPAHGSRGALPAAAGRGALPSPPRPRDELPHSVRPLNAPQAAERAAGSSLPGFVPCDCGGSEVRSNGDNASVYPRSPGNPKGGSPRNTAALHAGALAVPAPGLPSGGGEARPHGSGARSCSGPEPEREPRGSPADTGRPGPDVAPGPRARCPPAARPFPGDEKFRPCPPLCREPPAEPRALPARRGFGLPAAAVSLLVLRRSPLPARALTK